MLSLENKRWESFCTVQNNMYQFVKCKTLTTTDLDGEEGILDIVGATTKNNGNVFFANKKYKEYEINKNVICLIKTGQGSVGKAVYKGNNFIPSNNVAVLTKNNLNIYTGLFTTTLINKCSDRYSYGYIRNDKRIQRERNMYPISDNKEIDWDFIEQYTKSLRNKKIKDYKKYCENILKNIEFKEILSIEDKEWEEFFIGGEDGLFNVTSTLSGIDKNKLVLSNNGKIPYITRTDINNGIKLFIPNNQLTKYKKNDGNVITIGLDTQTVFYQPHNFFTGQNIQVMKHNLLNKYNALFLIPLIKIQMEKFNWGGNGATLGRLARTKIMLPVNKKNKPDFEYMEQYIKNITYKKINQYLNYLEKKN